jgi:hypothetical protein
MLEEYMRKLDREKRLLMDGTLRVKLMTPQEND